MTTVWIFCGSTEPSAFCKYSMVTWVLPSGRNHHRSPFLRTSVNFLPRRVAMECVKGMHSSSNVWALLVDAHDDLTSLVAQTLAIYAGKVVYERVKSDLGHNTTNNFLIVDLCLSCDLSHHGTMLSLVAVSQATLLLGSSARQVS